MTHVSRDADEDYTVIHLAVGPDKSGVTHARAWEIPHEAMEQAAALLTAAYGAPTDWIINGDGSEQVVLYD